MKNRSERADSFSDISHQIEKNSKEKKQKTYIVFKYKNQNCYYEKADYCCVPRHRRFIKLDLVRWRTEKRNGKKNQK